MSRSLLALLLLAVGVLAACTYPADPYRIDLTKLERSYIADEQSFVAWDRAQRLEIVRARPADPPLAPHESQVRVGRAALVRCVAALREGEDAVAAAERNAAPLDEARSKLDSAKVTCSATRRALADLGVTGVQP